MLPKIESYISDLEFATIKSERKQELFKLIDYIQQRKNEDTHINLNFICTHNSRRSHLCQVWAKTASYFYNIKKVHCYSGGTEETAVYPMIIKTLQSVGFDIYKLDQDINPTYKLNFTEEKCPLTLFSKLYNNKINPSSNFASVMTCNNADKNCPLIPNSIRISVKYHDPKAFDNSPIQAEKYEERSNQIATEMFYVFSQII